MDFLNISVGLAFLAGLASFLSPCVFALVPAYVGYLGGRSLSAVNAGTLQDNRWITFSHGLAFVIGFSVVFVTLGLAVSAIGSVLLDLRSILARVGGVVVVIFGLHMTGIINLPFLEYDLRKSSMPDRSLGYFSSAMLGVFFSAGWSPCVGPVLGAILTLALNGGSLAQGAVLLTAYSAGLAIPFLAASLGVDWVTKILRNHGNLMRKTQQVMGVLLIILGLMLFFGRLELLARYGVWVDFGL